MKFKDFLMSCSDSEKLHIYINNKIAIKCLVSDFTLNEDIVNMNVNSFFSWCDGKHDGVIYDTYIEVYLV